MFSTLFDLSIIQKTPKKALFVLLSAIYVVGVPSLQAIVENESALKLWKMTQIWYSNEDLWWSSCKEKNEREIEEGGWVNKDYGVTLFGLEKWMGIGWDIFLNDWIEFKAFFAEQYIWNKKKKQVFIKILSQFILFYIFGKVNIYTFYLVLA